MKKSTIGGITALLLAGILTVSAGIGSTVNGKWFQNGNLQTWFNNWGQGNFDDEVINPYRLGFKNSAVDTHFNLPFECICITEAQKYLNSRMSMYFPDWQSRWYEQHGHNDLDIWLDTQRPMLIDINIRELSQFVEIVKLELIRNDYGNVSGLKWIIRQIDNSGLFDKYMASGKTDKSCYTEKVVTANYNVFQCYDSQSCKPKFYDGHLDEDFDYLAAVPLDSSIDGYIKYLQETDDELPDNFYQRRKSSQ